MHPNRALAQKVADQNIASVTERIALDVVQGKNSEYAEYAAELEDSLSTLSPDEMRSILSYLYWKNFKGYAEDALMKLRFNQDN